MGTFKKLHVLALDINQKISDAGLKELSGLSKLESLDLHNTQVTGAGLKALASLKELEFLDLSYTKSTDAGLKELAALKQLKELYIADFLDMGKISQVTNAGVAELQKALPSLKVEVNPRPGT